MDFSVVVCTYNRSHNLPSCIQALAAQEGSERIQWEVLVVDNNSTDDTAATVERLRSKHRIGIRYTFEPQQGLSNARNCGVRQTVATHVIFIDDDIHVCPFWLRSYAEVFAQYSCYAAGGPIRVVSPKALPAWIRPDMMGFLGQLDYGHAPCELDGITRYPFGGNMAFHRRALQHIGDFDPNLGRRGSVESPDALFKGEETAYFRAAAEAGFAIWYTPGAEVLHRILPYQLERRFFLKIHYNQGYKAVLQSPPPEGRMFMGTPLYLYNQILRSVRHYLTLTILQGPNASMRQLMTVANFLGRARAYRALRAKSTS